jgi:hypothetical protein
MKLAATPVFLEFSTAQSEEGESAQTDLWGSNRLWVANRSFFSENRGLSHLLLAGVSPPLPHHERFRRAAGAFFSNAVNLEKKPAGSQLVFNRHRVHSSLGGHTAAEVSGDARHYPPLPDLVHDRRNRVRRRDLVFQKPENDFCNGLEEVLQKRSYSQRAAEARQSARIANFSHQRDA